MQSMLEQVPGILAAGLLVTVLTGLAGYAFAWIVQKLSQ